MKIDQRNTIPFDANKIKENRTLAAGKSKSLSNQSSTSNKVGEALNGVIDEIHRSGMTGAQVHSNMDEGKASGLLKSAEVSADSKPTPESLLKIADQVASDSQKNPSQAVAAFKSFDSSRVAQLV